MNDSPAVGAVLKNPIAFWALMALSSFLIWRIFNEGLVEMASSWQMDEYSHGYLIPFISLFLVWQRKDILETAEFKGSWLGTALVLCGVTLFYVGSMGSVIDIKQSLLSGETGR